MTRKKAKWLLLSFVILFGFIYLFTYLPYSNDGPRGIHQWAQSDRIAICLRFIEGKPLNDPATLSMKTTDGNTGVEFSGYQYIIAQIIRMGVSQDYLFIIYRLLTFSIFFSSFFLLLFNVLDKEKILYRIFIFLGLISSPLLLYYGYNFLPDILGLSLLLVCFYFFHKDFEKYFYHILIISGLALLIKTSSGIYFISFMAIYFLKYWNKWNKKLILGGVIFLIIGGGVFYYDYFLVNMRNKEFNSYVFLSGTMPTRSWAEFLQIFDTASRFTSEYFNGAQRTLIALLSVIGLFRLKGIRFKNIHTQLAILVGLGLLTILILFGVQYMNHDYYVIATFMPILIYFIIKGIAYLSQYIHPRTSLVIATIFAVISFSLGNQKYFNRMSEIVWVNGYPEYYERNWAVNAAKKIEPYVPKDALVFSVYSPEPNFALVYFNRKGATFNTEEMQRSDSPFTWFLKYLSTKYVICYSRFTDQLKKDHPNFVTNARVLYTDDQFTLYEKDGH